MDLTSDEKKRVQGVISQPKTHHKTDPINHTLISYTAEGKTTHTYSITPELAQHLIFHANGAWISSWELQATQLHMPVRKRKACTLTLDGRGTGALYKHVDTVNTAHKPQKTL